jgi:Protein of unknown function (DUF3489)
VSGELAPFRGFTARHEMIGAGRLAVRLAYRVGSFVRLTRPRSGAPADTQPGAAATRTPRAGTKQALIIALLKRPEGATVEQIAAATGWQHHTIRGAISGALKKRFGLTVEAIRTREVGPNRTGANGSSTVYRIIGSGPEAGTRLGAGPRDRPFFVLDQLAGLILQCT